MRGEVRTIGSAINVVGVDDPAFGEADVESALLSSIQNGHFTVLLKHRPWVLNSSLGQFDLQLSGHTHGGQIFPFIYVVSRQYPLPIGMIALQKAAFIYTSRGSGTWGPQMRLLSPPEVTAIELVRKSSRSG